MRDAVAGGGDAPGRWVEVLGRAGLISHGALHGLIAALIVRAILTCVAIGSHLHSVVSR